jgi:hypothetical protein
MAIPTINVALCRIGLDWTEAEKDRLRQDINVKFVEKTLSRGRPFYSLSNEALCWDLCSTANIFLAYLLYLLNFGRSQVCCALLISFPGSLFRENKRIRHALWLRPFAADFAIKSVEGYMLDGEVSSGTQYLIVPSFCDDSQVRNSTSRQYVPGR